MEAKVETKDNDSYTPLHLAAFRGDLVTLRDLIEVQNVDIRSKTKNGKTILHIATVKNHYNLVAWILTQAPDLLTMRMPVDDFNQFNAIDFAMLHNHKSIIELFLSDEETPVEYIFLQALRFERQQYIDQLLPQIDKTHAAIFAAAFAHLPLMKTLVKKYQVNLSTIKFDEESILRLATRSHLFWGEPSNDFKVRFDFRGLPIADKKAEMARWLIEKQGMGMHERNKHGETLLHHAAFLGNKILILYLLQKGIDITLQNNYGSSALHITHKFPATFLFLLENGCGLYENFNEELKLDIIAQAEYDTPILAIGAQFHCDPPKNFLTSNEQLRQALAAGTLPNTNVLQKVVEFYLHNHPMSTELQETNRLLKQHEYSRNINRFFIKLDSNQVNARFILDTPNINLCDSKRTGGRP